MERELKLLRIDSGGCSTRLWALETHGWTGKEAQAKKASGIRLKAFRAPNLWVSETTLRVLDKEAYRLGVFHLS